MKLVGGGTKRQAGGGGGGGLWGMPPSQKIFKCKRPEMPFPAFSGCGCNLHKTKEIELHRKQFFGSVLKGHGNPF